MHVNIYGLNSKSDVPHWRFRLCSPAQQIIIHMAWKFRRNDLRFGWSYCNREQIISSAAFNRKKNNFQVGLTSKGEYCSITAKLIRRRASVITQIICSHTTNAEPIPIYSGLFCGKLIQFTRSWNAHLVALNLRFRFAMDDKLNRKIVSILLLYKHRGANYFIIDSSQLFVHQLPRLYR